MFSFNRDSPDESQTGVNIRAFPAFPQDSREVRTATGASVPDQPGPVMAYVCALLPVVRELATLNTSDQLSSIGMM
jgi:hypothetical protein